MARPKIDIDKRAFEKLGALQCTQEEIASTFDCSADTISRWCKKTYGKCFADVFAEKRLAGLASLRATQFQLAKRSAALAIFLGKNYLGQRDHKEVEITRPVDETIAEMEAYFEEQEDAGQNTDI